MAESIAQKIKLVVGDRDANIELLKKGGERDKKFIHNDVNSLVLEFKSNPSAAKKYGFSVSDVQAIEDWVLKTRKLNAVDYKDYIGPSGVLYTSPSEAQAARKSVKGQAANLQNIANITRFGGELGSEQPLGFGRDILSGIGQGLTLAQRMRDAEVAGRSALSELPDPNAFNLRPGLAGGFKFGAGVSESFPTQSVGLAGGTAGGVGSSMIASGLLSLLPAGRAAQIAGAIARPLAPAIGAFIGAQKAGEAVQPFLPQSQLSQSVQGDYLQATSGPEKTLGTMATTLSMSSPLTRSTSGKLTAFGGMGMRGSIGYLSKGGKLTSGALEPFVDAAQRVALVTHGDSDAIKNNKIIADKFFEVNGYRGTVEELKAFGGYKDNRERLFDAATNALMGGIGPLGRSISGVNLIDRLGNRSAQPSVQGNIPQVRPTPEIAPTAGETSTPSDIFAGSRDLVRVNIRPKELAAGEIAEAPSTLYYNPETFESRYGIRQGIPKPFISAFATHFERTPEVASARDPSARMNIRGVLDTGEFFVEVNAGTEKQMYVLGYSELPEQLRQQVDSAERTVSYNRQMLQPGEFSRQIAEYNPRSDANKNFGRSFDHKLRLSVVVGEGDNRSIKRDDVFVHVKSVDSNGIAKVELPSGNELNVPVDILSTTRKDQTLGESRYRRRVTDIERYSISSGGNIQQFADVVDGRALMRNPSVAGDLDPNAYIGRTNPSEVLRPGTLVNIGMTQYQNEKGTYRSGFGPNFGVVVGHETFNLNGELAGGYRIQSISDPLMKQFIASGDYISPLSPDSIPEFSRPNARTREISDASSELAVRQQEYDDLRAEYDRLNQLLTDSQEASSQLESLINEKDNLERQLSDAQISIEDFEDRLADINEQLDALFDELIDNGAYTEEQQKLRDELIAEKNAIEQQLEDANKIISQVDDYKKQIEEYEIKIAELEDAMSSKPQVDPSQVEDLNSRLQAAASEIEDLKRKIEEMSAAGVGGTGGVGEGRGGSDGTGSSAAANLLPSEYEFPYGDEFAEPAEDKNLPLELRSGTRGGEQFKFYRQTKGEQAERSANVNSIPEEMRRDVFNRMVYKGDFSGFGNISFEGVKNADEFSVRLQEVWGQSKEQADALSAYVDRWATGWAFEMARLSGIQAKERVVALRTPSELRGQLEFASRSEFRASEWRTYYREQTVIKPTDENYKLIAKLKASFYTDRFGSIVDLTKAIQAREQFKNVPGFTVAFKSKSSDIVNIAFALNGRGNFSAHVHEVNHLIVRALYAPMYHELAGATQKSLADQYINLSPKSVEDRQKFEIPINVEEQIVTALTNTIFEAGKGDEGLRLIRESYREGGGTNDASLNVLLRSVGTLMVEASTNSDSFYLDLNKNKAWASRIDLSRQYRKGTPILVLEGDKYSEYRLSEPTYLTSTGMFSRIAVESQSGEKKTISNITQEQVSGEKPFIKIGQVVATAGDVRNRPEFLSPEVQKVIAKLMGHWVDHTNELIKNISIQVEPKEFVPDTTVSLLRRTVGTSSVAENNPFYASGTFSPERKKNRAALSYLGWLDYRSDPSATGYNAYIDSNKIKQLEYLWQSDSAELGIKTETSEESKSATDALSSTRTEKPSEGIDITQILDPFDADPFAMMSTLPSEQVNQQSQEPEKEYISNREIFHRVITPVLDVLSDASYAEYSGRKHTSLFNASELANTIIFSKFAQSAMRMALRKIPQDIRQVIGVEHGLLPIDLKFSSHGPDTAVKRVLQGTYIKKGFDPNRSEALYSVTNAFENYQHLVRTSGYLAGRIRSLTAKIEKLYIPVNKIRIELYGPTRAKILEEYTKKELDVEEGQPKDIKVEEIENKLEQNPAWFEQNLPDKVKNEIPEDYWKSRNGQIDLLETEKAKLKNDSMVNPANERANGIKIQAINKQINEIKEKYQPLVDELKLHYAQIAPVKEKLNEEKKDFRVFQDQLKNTKREFGDVAGEYFANVYGSLKSVFESIEPVGNGRFRVPQINEDGSINYAVATSSDVANIIIRSIYRSTKSAALSALSTAREKRVHFSKAKAIDGIIDIDNSWSAIVGKNKTIDIGSFDSGKKLTLIVTKGEELIRRFGAYNWFDKHRSNKNSPLSYVDPEEIPVGDREKYGITKEAIDALKSYRKISGNRPPDREWLESQPSLMGIPALWLNRSRGLDDTYVGINFNSENNTWRMVDMTVLDAVPDVGTIQKLIDDDKNKTAYNEYINEVVERVGDSFEFKTTEGGRVNSEIDIQTLKRPESILQMISQSESFETIAKAMRNLEIAQVSDDDIDSEFGNIASIDASNNPENSILSKLNKDNVRRTYNSAKRNIAIANSILNDSNKSQSEKDTAQQAIDRNTAILNEIEPRFKQASAYLNDVSKSAIGIGNIVSYLYKSRKFDLRSLMSAFEAVSKNRLNPYQIDSGIYENVQTTSVSIIKELKKEFVASVFGSGKELTKKEKAKVDNLFGDSLVRFANHVNEVKRLNRTTSGVIEYTKTPVYYDFLKTLTPQEAAFAEIGYRLRIILSEIRNPDSKEIRNQGQNDLGKERFKQIFGVGDAKLSEISKSFFTKLDQYEQEKLQDVSRTVGDLPPASQDVFKSVIDTLLSAIDEPVSFEDADGNAVVVDNFIQRKYKVLSLAERIEVLFEALSGTNVGNDKVDAEYLKNVKDKIQNVFQSFDYDETFNFSYADFVSLLLSHVRSSQIIAINGRIETDASGRKVKILTGEKSVDRSSKILTSLKARLGKNAIESLGKNGEITYPALVSVISQSDRNFTRSVVLNDSELMKIAMHNRDLNSSQDEYRAVAVYGELVKSRNEYVLDPLKQRLNVSASLQSSVSIADLNLALQYADQFTPEDKLNIFGILGRYLSDGRQEALDYYTMYGELPETDNDIKQFAQFLSSRSSTQRSASSIEDSLKNQVIDLEKMLQTVGTEFVTSASMASSIEISNNNTNTANSFMAFGMDVPVEHLLPQHQESRRQIITKYETLGDDQLKDLIQETYKLKKQDLTLEERTEILRKIQTSDIKQIATGFFGGSSKTKKADVVSRYGQPEPIIPSRKITGGKYVEDFYSTIRRNVTNGFRDVFRSLNDTFEIDFGSGTQKVSPIGQNKPTSIWYGNTNPSRVATLVNTPDAVSGDAKTRASIRSYVEKIAHAAAMQMVDQRVAMIDAIQNSDFVTYRYQYNNTTGLVEVRDAASNTPDSIIYRIDYKNANVFDADGNRVYAPTAMTTVTVGKNTISVNNLQRQMIMALMDNDFTDLVRFERVAATVYSLPRLKTVPAVYFHGINRIQSMPESGIDRTQDIMFMSTLNQDAVHVNENTGLFSEITRDNYVMPIVNDMIVNKRILLSQDGTPIFDGHGWTVMDKSGNRSGIFANLVGHGLRLGKALEIYAMTEHPRFQWWMRGDLIESPMMHNSGSWLHQQRISDPTTVAMATKGMKAIDALISLDRFVSNPTDKNFDTFAFHVDQVHEIGSLFNDRQFIDWMNKVKSDKDVSTAVMSIRPIIEEQLNKNKTAATRQVLDTYSSKKASETELKTGTPFTTLGFVNSNNKMYAMSTNGMKSFDLASGLYKNSSRKNKPQFIRFEKPLVHDAKNNGVDRQTYVDLLKKAIDSGYDGLVLTNLKESVYDSIYKTIAISLNDSNVLDIKDMDLPKTTGPSAKIDDVIPVFMSTLPANFTATTIPAASGVQTISRPVTGLDIASKVGGVVLDNIQDVTRFTLSHDVAYGAIQGGKSFLGAFVDPLNKANRRAETFISVKALYRSLAGWMPNLQISLGAKNGKSINVGLDKVGRRQYMQIYKAMSSDPFFDICRKSKVGLHFIEMERKIEQERMRIYNEARGSLAYRDIELNLMDFDESGHLPDMFERKTILTWLPFRGMAERQMSLHHDILMFELLKNQYLTNPVFSGLSPEDLVRNDLWKALVRFNALGQGDLQYSSNEITDMWVGRFAKVFLQAPRWYAANVLANPLVNMAAYSAYETSDLVKKALGSDPKMIWYNPDIWKNKSVRNYILSETLGTLIFVSGIPLIVQWIGRMLHRPDMGTLQGKLGGYRIGDWTFSDTTGVTDQFEQPIKLMNSIWKGNYGEAARFGYSVDETNKQNYDRFSSVLNYRLSPGLNKINSLLTGKDVIGQPIWGKDNAWVEAYADTSEGLYRLIKMTPEGRDLEPPFSSRFLTGFGLSWIHDYAEAYQDAKRQSFGDQNVARWIGLKASALSYIGTRARYAPFEYQEEKDNKRLRWGKTLQRVYEGKPRDLDSLETFIKGR